MQRYKALLKVVELNSFTKATLPLGYTQSALSKMIISLEKDLQLKLLHRSKDGISLTHEGERLYPAIKETVRHYEAIHNLVQDITSLEGVTLRIGVTALSKFCLSPAFYESFWEKFPNVNLQFYQGTTKTLEDWMNAGKIDVAFINKAFGGCVKYKLSKTIGFTAIVGIDHKLADSKILNFEHLYEEPLLLLDEELPQSLSNYLEEKAKSTQNRLVTSDITLILQLAQKGHGIALMPNTIYKQPNLKVKAVTIKPRLSLKTYLVCRDTKLLSPVGKHFYTFLVNNKY